MIANNKVSAIINTIGSLVVFLAQGIISILIVRIGDYSDAGVFGLAISVSNVFCFFANYNIRNYQVSDVKREFSQSVYFASRVITIIVSCILCLIYLAMSNGYSLYSMVAIFLYLLYSDINLLSDIMMGAVQLKGHLEVNGYSNIIRGILCFIAFIIAYSISNNLILSLLIMDFGTILVLFLYDKRKYNLYGYGLNIKIGVLRKDIDILLKKCFWLMLSSIFPIVINAIPRRKIQLYYGEEILGYFSSIFIPTVLITTIAPAIILAIVPSLSEQYQDKNKKNFLKIIMICYLICILFTVVAEIFAFLFGKPIMKILFGNEILKYFDWLYLAILATGLNSFTSCGNTILIVMRRKKTVAIMAFLSMLLTIIIAPILVKNNGGSGAAMTLIIAYGVQSFLQVCGMKWRKCE